ncbi:MAG: TIGR00730 family Rossman fold protein [Alphaproteobacteria bacterium]|nr:TIGR00730 family Rossman fold protein [Alphaproteobacteria bacterium]
MTNIRSLCVYCGSSSGVRETHRNAAHALGATLAKAGIRLVFGGGRVGLMGVVADAALENNGEVIGVIPKFLEQREVGHSECSELIVTDNMHDRKLKMATLSDAFAILPGGLGTLDETFEILTWKQLELHDKPIVIIDIDGYWKPLAALIESQITENYVRAEYRNLFTIAPTVAEVLPMLEAMPPERFSLESKWL